MLHLKPTHSQRGWIGAAIAAGAAILGQIDTNARNRKEAKKNRDFQERLSNSSKQRELTDLKKAGINPLLAANGGASTPSGAQATAQNPVSDGLIASGNTVSAQKLQKTMQTAQIGNLEADNQLKASQKTASDMDAALKLSQSQESSARSADIRLGSALKTKDLKYYEAQRIADAIPGMLNLGRSFRIPKSLKKPQKINNKLNKKTGEVEQWIK